MAKKGILSFLLLSVYLSFCFIIYQDKPTNIKTVEQPLIGVPALSKEETKKDNLPLKEEKILGILEIPKINLRKIIYPLTDKQNNVEQNVTILKESILPAEQDSIVFLAAHSGTGTKAFFTRLDELSKKDIIKFTYLNKTYYYEVEIIEEQEKIGTINIPKKEGDYLILTTCSEKDKAKQLVISCKRQEKM